MSPLTAHPNSLLSSLSSQPVEETNRLTASTFLEALVEAIPYRIHTVLTDNGIQFTFSPRYKDGLTAKSFGHMFDKLYHKHNIEHRLTKPRHPWTNGQVERMNRTIKQATVQCYHYVSHTQLTVHLYDFINAYNYARRLKALKGMTPYEYICNQWQIKPYLFNKNPCHEYPGLNTLGHVMVVLFGKHIISS